MRKTLSTFVFLFSALLSLAFSGGMAHANEKASASASASTPTTRLEPFVVNLASFDRYLQTAVTLQLAASDVADKVKVFMPMVRHVVIMTLSSKDSAELQSTEGKKVLIDELRAKINQVLETKNDHGVNDVFFETFVIQ
jgi:flagellar FliL protein|nr:flagellar basal body-associated FliL family protein [uncultured Undibacterium sp.]